RVQERGLGQVHLAGDELHPFRLARLRQQADCRRVAPERAIREGVDLIEIETHSREPIPLCMAKSFQLQSDPADSGSRRRFGVDFETTGRRNGTQSIRSTRQEPMSRSAASSTVRQEAAPGEFTGLLDGFREKLDRELAAWLAGRRQAADGSREM